MGVSPAVIPHKPLSSYSTGQLRELAVRAYKRRRTWYHPSKIEPSSIIKIGRISTHSGRGRLLPGGLYLMDLSFPDLDEPTLELYDLAKQKRTWNVTIEDAKRAEVYFDLEYGSENVLNIAVSIVNRIKPNWKNRIVVLQLNMASMTHKRFEYQSGVQSAPLYTPSISEEHVLMGWDGGIYVLNWQTGKEVVLVTKDGDTEIISARLVCHTLIYCTKSENPLLFKFQNLLLVDLDQQCIKGGPRCGDADVYTLPGGTPNEMALHSNTQSFRNIKYSVTSPSWDTGYLTKVVLAGSQSVMGGPYTVYFFSSTIPNKSTRQHVGPFELRRVIKLGWEGMVSPGGFWCNRAGVGTMLTYKAGVEGLFAVRFDEESFDEGRPNEGEAPFSQCLEMRSLKSEDIKVWDIDPYTGAIAFLEKGSFVIWRFD